jgi:hypothetical protein
MRLARHLASAFVLVALGAVGAVAGSTASPAATGAAGLAKLDWSLAALVQPRHTPVRAVTPVVVSGHVNVEVLATNVRRARAAITRLGGTVSGSVAGVIDARLPVDSLAALAQGPEIRFVRPPAQGVADDVQGEEVQASMAGQLHAQGITGKGAKVAIIDESFAGLSTAEASGDLPSNVVTQDMCGGGFDTGDGHGTAVAEIVHEMAPDAQLHLICFGNIVSLGDAVSYVESQRIPIVNFSIEYFNVGRGTNDPSDPVDALIADARAQGVLWVNSAGNDADTHWTGNYVDANGNGLGEWSGADENNTFRVRGSDFFCGLLKWDEWPSATSDFDLALVDPGTGQVLARSSTVQNGSQPPTEDLCVDNPSPNVATYAWTIVGKHVTTNPRLDLYTIDTSSLQYQTGQSSIGDPASSPSALAVGAVCWQNNALEFYSSQGPTIDGRVKPDIAGHDSVSGVTFGPFEQSCPSGFAGTSASSPEVAGAAALVKGANPRFTPAQLQAFLEKSVLDVGPAGPDDQTGFGVLDLPASIAVPDTLAPKTKALASKGAHGHVVKLLAQAFDDSGAVKLRDQVKRNGRLIKTITTGFVSTPKTITVTLKWLAPLKLKGAFTHCVSGQDRAGNVGATTCARVTLTG